MKCPNCGGSVKDNPDAEGSIGACEDCSLAVDTSLSQEEQPAGGGVAPPVSGEVPVARPDTGENGTGAPMELPAGNAGREAWAEAAVKLGLDPDAFDKVADLKEAVEAAVLPGADMSLNAPDGGDAPE